MIDTADVVVVGGGVNGTSIAYALAARGVRVVLCEKGAVASGASGRSSALVRMHYTNEWDARLAFASFPVFQRWAEVMGGPSVFTRTGFVNVVAPPCPLIDLIAPAVYLFGNRASAGGSPAPRRPAARTAFGTARERVVQEDAMFKGVVTSESELRQLMGMPSERAVKKESACIDEHGRDFIAHSPFLLLATASASGRCDVSPKGDAPGFVHVLDERRLVIPDRPGNKRLDGMRNILENPHVGLIFLIPGREETLRVNGRAWIVRDEEILAKLSARDKLPQLAIAVETEEVFFHCPKAFRRSKLWEPASWPDRDALPTMACVLYEKLQPAGKTLEEYLRESEEGLQRTLY